MQGPQIQLEVGYFGIVTYTSVYIANYTPTLEEIAQKRADIKLK